MATMELLSSEWTARALRPVARWVPETTADGRTRPVMLWSVPDVNLAETTADARV
ncbi:MAG: hypothetical protein ACKVZ6_12560 [Kineosporiaceae bacterium]|jgi:hypothetical protein